MDRKTQLRNVAFGGAWSEQIAGNEALADAMALVERAVERTEEEDLRDDLALVDAVAILAKNHPKGHELARAWFFVLSKSNGYERRSELKRLAELFKAALGSRLKI